MRTSLTSRARRAVAGSGPPTFAFGVRRRDSGLSEHHEATVLDMALRTGEALVATGAPVADVTLAMQRMAAGFGVVGAQIDITFNSITVSIDRDDRSLTRVRVIEVRTSDYSRLTALMRLVDDAADRRIGLVEAAERLEALLVAPHPYRRWVVTIALGAMAAGVAVLLGGGWQVALLAAATTVVIDRVLRSLRHRGLPYLFQQALGSAIATSVALVLLWGQGRFGWDVSVLPPSLVVASGIVVLLAGLSLVGAAQDAISGFPLTAAARSYEVILYTVGIVIGIGFVLDVGSRFGVPLAISDLDFFSASVPVRVIAGAVIAAAWAVASYTPWRLLPLVAGIGGVGVLINNAIGAVGLGPSGRAFVAALAVGAVAGLAARRFGAPVLVVAVCGITPMLPGLTIYRAMFGIVESGNLLAGSAELVQAVSVGLALAAGVTLGEFVASNTRLQTDRWQRALRRRARGARI